MDALEELIDIDAMYEEGESEGGEVLARTATNFYLEDVFSPLTNANIVKVQVTDSMLLPEAVRRWTTAS